MNLVLVGTGRMGTAVEDVAVERGHTVLARFNSSRPLPDERGELAGADVVVDFSMPDLAVPHIERYCRWGVPAVIGTTGWYDRLDVVNAAITEHEAVIFYAANFSLGVAMLTRSLQAITPLLDRLPEYDASIHEVHHTNKVDSPSGTAQMLGKILVDGLARKGRVEAETQHGRISENALHVTSSRTGGVIGRHTILLDSSFDELTLEHRAKSRMGFAFGAVRAAEWLPGRRGLFTMDDILDEWMK